MQCCKHWIKGAAVALACLGLLGLPTQNAEADASIYYGTQYATFYKSFNCRGGVAADDSWVTDDWEAFGIAIDGNFRSFFLWGKSDVDGAVPCYSLVPMSLGESIACTIVNGLTSWALGRGAWRDPNCDWSYEVNYLYEQVG